MEHTTPQPQQSFYRLFLQGARKSVGTIAIILLFIGVVGVTPLVIRDFNLAATRVPERFSETYFINHQQLPKTVHVGEPAAFAFGITNHESQTKTYSYRVLIAEGDQPAREIARQEVTLGSGTFSQQHVTFTATRSGAALKVTVELVNTSQSIHFWSQS